MIPTLSFKYRVLGTSPGSEVPLKSHKFLIHATHILLLASTAGAINPQLIRKFPPLRCSWMRLRCGTVQWMIHGPLVITQGQEPGYLN